MVCLENFFYMDNGSTVYLKNENLMKALDIFLNDDDASTKLLTLFEELDKNYQEQKKRNEYFQKDQHHQQQQYQKPYQKSKGHK